MMSDSKGVSVVFVRESNDRTNRPFEINATSIHRGGELFYAPGALVTVRGRASLALGGPS